jgi:hypothetical protein
LICPYFNAGQSLLREVKGGKRVSIFEKDLDRLPCKKKREHTQNEYENYRYSNFVYQ